MTGVVRRLACVLVLLFLADVLVACSGTSKAADVSIPSVAASPARVARVSLHAALASNCKLTAALPLPHTCNWCDDPKMPDYRGARPPYSVSALTAGRNEECV